MTKEEAIINNQKLVYSVAKYFNNYSNKEDLYQAGYMGIIKAYNNYNSNIDCKFSTYSYKYILGEMRKLVREDKGVKISRQISKLNLQIEKAYILLSQKLMRVPSITELANFLEEDEYLICEAINSTNSIKSIDEIINGEDGYTLQEVIGESKDIDNLILLKQYLQKLPQNEQDLIKNRYIDDLTQSETSKIMHMSQVQVSRQEKKVLQKLRRQIVA